MKPLEHKYIVESLNSMWFYDAILMRFYGSNHRNSLKNKCTSIYKSGVLKVIIDVYLTAREILIN